LKIASYLISGTDVESMASGALARGGSIDDDLAILPIASRGMAPPAAYLPMRSLKPVAGLSIVIKGGRHPFLDRMALSTIQHPRAGGKLSTVYVFMALGALPGRFCVIYLADSHTRDFFRMTLGACNIFMSALEREICGGMIKTEHFVPGRLGMAASATRRSSVRVEGGHARGELFVVRIFMASDTFPRCGFVNDTFCAHAPVGRRVAFLAGNRFVPAFQRKISGCMIERIQLLPRIRIMATAAARHGSVRQ
jgi:hypothetical protein